MLEEEIVIIADVEQIFPNEHLNLVSQLIQLVFVNVSRPKSPP